MSGFSSVVSYVVCALVFKCIEFKEKAYTSTHVIATGDDVFSVGRLFIFYLSDEIYSIDVI